MTGVAWAATSPESGRFDALVSQSDLRALNERFDALRARGEGYLEVRRADDYPALTLGFRENVAVIEAFVDEETMSILLGDGSCVREEVQVPSVESDVTYSGQAGIDVGRAWSLVLEFLEGRALSELGEWFEL